MDENNLSFSMSQSITEECSELVSSIAEVTLDSVLEDGLLKKIGPVKIYAQNYLQAPAE